MGLLLSGMVRIKSAEVEEKTRKGSKGEYTERVQFAMAEVGEETRKIRVKLERGQPAYQPGMYELHTECRVNEWGDVMVPFILVLRPVTRAAMAPAAKAI